MLRKPLFLALFTALIVLASAMGFLLIQRHTPPGEAVVIPTLAVLPSSEAAQPMVDTAVAIAPTRAAKSGKEIRARVVIVAMLGWR